MPTTILKLRIHPSRIAARVKQVAVPQNAVNEIALVNDKSLLSERLSFMFGY
jgi:hypothetical protein